LGGKAVQEEQSAPVRHPIFRRACAPSTTTPTCEPPLSASCIPLERVTILEEGFAWNGQTFGSLSQIAKAMTGTNWNGHRFFGLRQGKVDAAGHGRDRRKGEASAGARKTQGASPGNPPR
jgi:hypothetical protein